MEFNSLSALEEYLKRQIDIALDTTVKDGMMEVIYDHAVADVYEKYTPSMYKRRYSLLDESNYDIDNSEDMSISVTATAEFNPEAYRYVRGSKKSKGHYVETASVNVGNELAGLINYGDGWNGYRYEFVSPKEAEHPTYTAPRPFLDYARENLADGIAKDLLVDGLNNLGIHAE